MTRAFRDRAEAGRALAERLLAYRSDRPIVVALPRGGVVVGAEIARTLDAPLDILAARKLGAPAQPELGLGAVAPGGVRIVDATSAALAGVGADELDEIARRETAEMERREQLYRGGRAPLDVRGRTVILVDDGIATGVTARAAVASLRRRGARRVVLAVGVCAPEAAATFRREADDLVAILVPRDLFAVGLYYEDFAPVSDEEVTALLEHHNGARSLAGAVPAAAGDRSGSERG